MSHTREQSHAYYVLHKHERDMRKVSWVAMNYRCNNPNSKDYARYGGRGISVCAEWSDYSIFAQDMGLRPCGMSLDRIDNNGNYCKENCRWATPKQQSRNCRNNLRATYRGITKTVIEWCEELGLPYRLTRLRILRKWTPERAFTTVCQKKGGG